MISKYSANITENITERKMILSYFDDLNYLQFKSHIYFHKESCKLEDVELVGLERRLNYMISNGDQLLSLWLADNFDEVISEVGTYVTTLNNNNNIVDISNMKVSDILDIIRSSISNNPTSRYIYIIFKPKNYPYKVSMSFCYNPYSSDYDPYFDNP